MKDCLIISLQKYAYRPILIFNRQPMIADPLNVFKGMNFNVVPCKNNVFICYLFDNVHCGQFSQFMGHICGKGPILPHQSLFVIYQWTISCGVSNKFFRHAEKFYFVKITKQNFSACLKIFLRRHMIWSIQAKFYEKIQLSTVQNRPAKFTIFSVLGT